MEIINSIINFFEYLFNSLVGQFGLSIAIIVIACLLLSVFSVNIAYIKRFIANSIVGVLALFGLKALGFITTITILDVILVSLLGIVGIVIVLMYTIFGINLSSIIG